MEDITDLLAPRNLPLELGELGTVTEADLIMPGVYDAILEFLETGLAVEAFPTRLTLAMKLCKRLWRWASTRPSWFA